MYARLQRAAAKLLGVLGLFGLLYLLGTAAAAVPPKPVLTAPAAS